MDVVFTRCAGLDVHKKSITACRMIPDLTGHKAEGIMELRTLGTMTRDLLVLADWLTEASMTTSPWKARASIGSPSTISSNRH